MLVPEKQTYVYGRYSKAIIKNKFCQVRVNTLEIKERKKVSTKK